MFFKKTLGLALAMMALTAPIYSYSNDCCDDCYDPCCTSGFTVYGDWLYWSPRKCTLDYALPYDGSNAIGKVHSVCPSYDNGYRIGLSKTCDCWTYGINYTHYHSDERSSVTDATNGDLAGTRIIDNYTVLSQGSIQFAKAKWDLDYDVISLYAGYNTTFNCVDTVIFGGFKFAFIDQKLDTLYTATLSPGSQDAIYQKNCLDAYGLTIGLTPSYNLCGCLNAFGTFSYDILAGNFDRTFDYRTSTNGGTTVLERARLKESCWNLLSVFNLSFGLRYDWMTCDKNFFLALGYEFHHWVNGFGFLEHQNESGEITLDRYHDSLGFDGLFLRAGVSF